jgi:hypothetical protein
MCSQRTNADVLVDQTVDGTVALNPSTASKASVGGSYARLTVNGGVEVEIVKL